MYNLAYIENDKKAQSWDLLFITGYNSWDGNFAWATYEACNERGISPKAYTLKHALKIMERMAENGELIALIPAIDSTEDEPKYVR